MFKQYRRKQIAELRPSLDKDLVEQRCKCVLEYLFPNYERQMTAKQYNNAMEALRSIAFGTPYERQMTAKQYNNAMEALRSIAFGTPAGKNYR